MALPPVATTPVPAPPAPPTPGAAAPNAGSGLPQQQVPVAPPTNPESTSPGGDAVHHPESHDAPSSAEGVQPMQIDGAVKSDSSSAASMASASPSASPSASASVSLQSQPQSQPPAPRGDAGRVTPAPGVVPARKKSSDPGVPPPPPPKPVASSPPPSSASAPATSPASSPAPSLTLKPPPPPPPPLAAASSPSGSVASGASVISAASAKDELPTQNSVGSSRTTRPTRPATRSVTSKSPRSNKAPGQSSSSSASASSASAKETLKPPEVLPPVVRTQLDQISGILQSENIAEAKATLKQSYESLLATLAANESTKQSDLSRMKEESSRHKKRIEKLRVDHLETRKAHANDKRRLTILRKQFDKAREERKAVAAARAAVDAPAAAAAESSTNADDAAEEDDDPLAKLPEDVKDWSEGDVGEWLSSFAWAKDYVKEFKESAVDGQLLFEIDAETLENDLGVKKKLHRMRLLREIKSLDVSVQDARTDSTPSTPVTPSAASVLASLSKSSASSSSRKRPSFSRGTPAKRQKTGGGKGKLTFRWGEPVEVDAWLDVEAEERWYPATIENVRASTREILVHFHRQTKRNDEWIDITSRRLAPYGRQTDDDAGNRDSDSDAETVATTPTIDVTPTDGGMSDEDVGGGGNSDHDMSDSEDDAIKSPPKAKRTAAPAARKLVSHRRRRHQPPRNPFDSDVRYASAFSAEPFTKIQHIFSDAELFSFMENYSQAGDKPSISVLRKQMRVGKMRARRSLNDFMAKWRNQEPLVPPQPPAGVIMSGRVPEGLKSIPTNYRPPSDKNDDGTESGSDSTYAEDTAPRHRRRRSGSAKTPKAKTPVSAAKKRRRESATAPKAAPKSAPSSKSAPKRAKKSASAKTPRASAAASPRTTGGKGKQSPQRRASALKAAAAARRQLLDGNKNEEIWFWNRKKNRPADAMRLWQSGVRDGLWQCPNSICGRILHVDRRLTHPCVRDGLVSARLNPPRVAKKKKRRRVVVTPSSALRSAAAAASLPAPPPPPFASANQSAPSAAQAASAGGGGANGMEDDDDEQDERFEIEKILDYRKDGDGSFAFQVKWRDFPDSDISWEPRENFPDDSPMLQQFLAEHDLVEQMPYMAGGGGSSGSGKVGAANGAAASSPSA